MNQFIIHLNKLLRRSMMKEVCNMARTDSERNPKFETIICYCLSVTLDG